MNVILHYVEMKTQNILVGIYGPIPESQAKDTLIKLAQKDRPDITNITGNFIRYQHLGNVNLLEVQPLKPI